MYRARVEAVDGLRVRAGGKWLTCIGNRVVRAGDMIWTDGRCVYGHDREAQTPLVIVNPEPKEAIPILMVSYGSNAPDGTPRQIGVYCDAFTFKSKNRRLIYEGCFLLPQTSLAFDDDTESIILKRVKSSADYLKRDAAGNVYCITSVPTGGEQVVEIKGSGGVGSSYITERKIQVMKNNTVIYETAPGKQHLEWAFIENENNWAFAAFDQYGEATGNHSSFSIDGYFFSKETGARQIFSCGGSGSSNLGAGDPYEVIENKFESFEAMNGLSMPVQDGYYLRIDKILPTPPYEISVPRVAKATLYSPNDAIIFSDYICPWSRISVCKIKSKVYLIGISINNFIKNIMYTSNYEVSPSMNIGDILKYNVSQGDYPQYLLSGIYLCTNQKLTWFLPEGYGWKSSIINNINRTQLITTALRSMKKWRHWWERIQTIE